MLSPHKKSDKGLTIGLTLCGLRCFLGPCPYICAYFSYL